MNCEMPDRPARRFIPGLSAKSEAAFFLSRGAKRSEAIGIRVLLLRIVISAKAGTQHLPALKDLHERFLHAHENGFALTRE
jgi:hypothetical protein